MCPTSNCEAKLSLCGGGKSYFKSSNKISYLFYADIKIKKKKVSFLDENSVYSMLQRFKDYFYTDVKTKTN